jgi:hypothetical protein
MTSPEQLIDALERGPSIVIPMIRQADAAVLKRRPAPRKWSIHEHACHLAVTDELYQRRLDIVLEQAKPVIKSYDPGRDEPEDALLHVDLGEALQRYTRLRRHLVRRLRTLIPKDWAKTAEHDEYNSYSMLIMIRHLALHDFFHAYRIEELLLRRDWPQPLASGVTL